MTFIQQFIRLLRNKKYDKEHGDIIDKTYMMLKLENPSISEIKTYLENGKTIVLGIMIPPDRIEIHYFIRNKDGYLFFFKGCDSDNNYSVLTINKAMEFTDALFEDLWSAVLSDYNYSLVDINDVLKDATEYYGALNVEIIKRACKKHDLLIFEDPLSQKNPL
ncbi:MAG: hypothetical protein IJH00_03420 [Erysipelotrichaceae bacterium]|nr:hypothetical protein [Erysipelotrichaceae bacterium]MBQ6493165.1 hypothetical protein [Erysipelotrichaceae bacterium]